MLSFDLRTLESKAAQVHDDLPASDPVWEPTDLAPDSAVRVEGRVSAAGDGRFYFSGHISGAVTLDCRRCLADVPVRVEDEVHVLFAPTGDTTTEDDPDVFLYDAGARELDIRPAVRESWLLAVPAFAQCKEDCKGLCRQCGTDLNTGTCTCAPESTDSRWDTLRHLDSASDSDPHAS
jgi:uncharacterized protein